MERDYSPFTPGQPVSVELFSGRVEQVRALERMVKKAVAGKLAVGFLTGERGMGKSSLAKYASELAERKHQILGLHVFLGGVNDLEEMARRVFDRLVKESIGRPWYNRVTQFLGNHVKEVGLFGISVQFDAGPRELRQAVNDFAPSLQRLTEQLKNEKRGLFLILDDINGLASSLDFANWLKSLVDEISVSRSPLPLFLLLVGLGERRQALLKSQESLSRVFELIEIPKWKDKECEDFFSKAFEQVNTKIDRNALEHMVFFAQGLPMLAHEIGDAIFRVDSDSKIDLKDAMLGVQRAAEVIGRKYLEPRVLTAIRSEKYKSIFEKLTAPPDAYPIFTRSALSKKLTPAESKILDNFLQRMRQLGVIEPEGGKGAYRFCIALHLLYFSMISESL